MSKARHFEVLLVLVVIATAGFLARNSHDHPRSAAASTPTPGATPAAVLPPRIASIGGIKLHDTAVQVKAKWGKPKSANRGDGILWWDYTGGFVGLDESQQVTCVAGKCLELDGKPILGPTGIGIEEVESELGKPDATGFAGVVMCEGPCPGYRYEQLKLSVDFSYSSGTFFRLEKQSRFRTFDNEPNAPDLNQCIASHRKGQFFAMPRGRK